MRRLTICAATALATAAVAAVPASAATDPASLALAVAIKHELQVTMAKRAPGLKITTVKCTVSKSGATGRCRANFTARAVGKTGYYVIAVKQPPKGQITWTSTSVVCTDVKSGLRVRC